MKGRRSAADQSTRHGAAFYEYDDGLLRANGVPQLMYGFTVVVFFFYSCTSSPLWTWSILTFFCRGERRMAHGRPLACCEARRGPSGGCNGNGVYGKTYDVYGKLLHWSQPTVRYYGAFWLGSLSDGFYGNDVYANTCDVYGKRLQWSQYTVRYYGAFGLFALSDGVYGNDVYGNTCDVYGK